MMQWICLFGHLAIDPDLQINTKCLLKLLGHASPDLEIIDKCDNPQNFRQVPLDQQAQARLQPLFVYFVLFPYLPYKKN
ncbi:hypothetical protein HUJ04_011522 [Dendroctonus ponderosae]|nr:hypothetical protein HUJ04_011522 [Dendroctonus ponderosae]